MGGIFPNDPTDDDSRQPGWERLEDSAARELELSFSPQSYRFHLNKTLRIKDQSIRPDVAVFVPDTKICVCVADAKDCHVLNRRDVEKVVRYKGLLDAERAIVFVRADCNVRASALKRAKEVGVEIQALQSVDY